MSTKFVQMMIVDWPLTLLRQGQICIPVHLHGENVEKTFSQNMLKTYGCNLQCIIIPGFCRVDTSTITIWTDQLPNSGCLATFYNQFVL